MSVNRHLAETARCHAVMILSHVNMFSSRIVQNVPARTPVNMELIALHHSDMCAILQVSQALLQAVGTSSQELQMLIEHAALQIGKLTDMFCYEVMI